ncbi:MAG: PhzF family phenazine biosynthesis isomerase [Epsilonproteobacteria bacterium]|nr:PhzF family phenazine biosynthesis isomerase [Campylobacterota bacterium]
MKIDIYQVDAFTDAVFGGSTSAVCPLNSWIDDTLMQKIAAENNLTKTAFFVPIADSVYEIRWFTPTDEVALCDHAALASAYVIFNYIEIDAQKITLSTISGDLDITKEEDLLTLSFPAHMPELYTESNPIFSLSMGIEPLKVLKSKDYILIYENEDVIKNLRPNIDVLRSLDLRGVCITAKGKEQDFVYRYFAPKLEIDVDLIASSVCSQLVPYWSKVHHKNVLTADQLSQRKGNLICEIQDTYVKIKGKAALFMRGEIIIEERTVPREGKNTSHKFAIAV